MPRSRGCVSRRSFANVAPLPWSRQMIYPHLKLDRWPFRVVPEPEFCTFIADRAQLRADIDALLDAALHREASVIRLLWAWFGAGKTHALYYLANRASALGRGESLTMIYSAYSEFPKSAKGFIDVYRAFVASLDFNELVDAFLEVSTSRASSSLISNLSLSSPDLLSSLQVAATGEPQDQLVAMRWLRGDALPVGQFRKVGISKGITTSEEAIANLVAIMGLLRAAATSQGFTRSTVMWLLDEFQRVEKASPKVRDEINAGLHSVFNACPSGLVIVLSFSGRPQQTLPDWFSPDLADRIGRTKVLLLPPMLPEEGFVFVRDVLEECRADGSKLSSSYFPFTHESCEAIINEIRSTGELKPRSLMQAFGAVLEEAEPRLRSGELDSISANYSTEVLSEYVSVMRDDTGES